jgi:hypothetical protein
MADLKISAATLNPAPAGTDNFATDKAGVDFRTTLAQIIAAVAAGDVFKVGTPLVDQIGVWTGDGTIKGFPGFKFDGSQLLLPNYSFPAADGSADQVLSTDGLGVVSFKDVTRGGGLLSAPYKFSTSTVAADPGPGLVRYNSATPASVTAIYIDDFDEDGIDVSNLLGLITTNDRIYLQTDKDSSEFLVFNVTAPITDNTGWFTITGTVEASGNLPGDGENLFTVLQIGGAAGGGGDVFKVGTPANNQIGVWTGDGTIEGDADLLWSGTNLFLDSGASLTVSSGLGTEDMTLFMDGDVARIGVGAGVQELLVGVGDAITTTFGGPVQTEDEAGPTLLDEVASATNPTLIPNRADLDTGVGWFGADAMSLIAGATEGIRLAESEGAVVISFGSVIVGFANGSPELRNIAASSTVPTLIPNKANALTGIGWNANGELSIIGDGIELARFIESGDSDTDQVFLPRDGAEGTPALAIGALDRGFYSAGVAQINASIGGSRVQFFGSSGLTQFGSIGVGLAAGPRMLSETPSATNPTLLPRQNDIDTGIGSNAAGSMSQISDGEESTRTVAASAGGLQANNQDTGGGLERVLTESDLLPNDVVQARRTTNYILTTAFVDITLDTTDVESDSAVIEHDALTDRIVAKVAGTYKIGWEVDAEATTTGDSNAELEGQVRVNDTSVLAGSQGMTGIFEDGSIDGDIVPQHLGQAFYATLAVDDFITLQLQKIEIASSETYEATRTLLTIERCL